MEASAGIARPYASQGHDAVRAVLEAPLMGRVVRRLLDFAGGGALLDLGCGDGLAGRLAADRLTRYLGLDLHPTATLPAIACDLRDGLGRLPEPPFDLYLGTFGVASHMLPEELRRLLAGIALHGRPGSVVALEALGLHSLEWPQVWSTAPGEPRVLPYRLGADVRVHPWSPAELFGMFEAAGIAPLAALDRTLQAGPKTGEGRYWPGLPPIRAALNDLLGGTARDEELLAPLPPLPAGLPARVHHALAARRRALVSSTHAGGAALARAVWGVEPASAGGYGHGLLVVGRVR